MDLSTYRHMAKPYYIRNSGQPITPVVVSQIRELAAGNTPTRVTAFKVGRTEASIRNIASGHGISLHPTNQSPYNR